MDGVLCDFVKRALEVLGAPDDFEFKPGIKYSPAMETWDGLGFSLGKFWKLIDSSGEDFWTDLDKLPWSDELMDYAHSVSSEVYILTSPSLNPNCASGKRRWMKNHYPKMMKNMIIANKKHLLANPRSVLIDDTQNKISDWVYEGGHGILFPQPWNDNYKMTNDRMEFVKQEMEHLNG